jgi:hypothetical protein
VGSLCDKGWVERRWHGDDAVFWFTDTGLAALDLNALRPDDPADLWWSYSRSPTASRASARSLNSSTRRILPLRNV